MFHSLNALLGLLGEVIDKALYGAHPRIGNSSLGYFHESVVGHPTLLSDGSPLTFGGAKLPTYGSKDGFSSAHWVSSP